MYEITYKHKACIEFDIFINQTIHTSKLPHHIPKYRYCYHTIFIHGQKSPNHNIKATSNKNIVHTHQQIDHWSNVNQNIVFKPNRSLFQHKMDPKNAPNMYTLIKNIVFTNGLIVQHELNPSRNKLAIVQHGGESIIAGRNNQQKL